jgi:hypothetical protein
MVRLILGLVKGVVLGAGLGYGATRVGLVEGSLVFAVAAGVGLVVGFLCGKPPWKQETIFTPIIKGVIGAGLCIGLFWGVRKLMGGLTVPEAILPALSLKSGATMIQAPALLAGVVGAIYGAFVELDDGGKSGKKPAKK